MNDVFPDALKGILLTEEGREPMKEIDYVVDEARSEILNDKARFVILQILREGIPDFLTEKRVDEKTGEIITVQRQTIRYALSVMEIINRSQDATITDEAVTMSQVYHHLPKLIEHGYIIKYGTITTGKRTTDYYRRTAHAFSFSEPPWLTESEKQEWLRNSTRNMLHTFGFDLPPEVENEFQNLVLSNYTIEREASEAISRRAQEDLATENHRRWHMELVVIRCMRNSEWVENVRKMERILFEK